jgi:ubiquinone/menaquinone biosynthesis C-methylase UbiE
MENPVSDTGANAQDRLKSFYDGVYEDREWTPRTLRPNAMSTTRYDDIFRLLPRSRGRLLDIGSGMSAFVLDMAEYFDDVVSMDLADSQIERARGLLKTHCPQNVEKTTFIQQNADDGLPFEDASFDGVIACAVVEHVVDVVFVVDEIARVLKPGGYALFTVPNIAYVRHVKDLLLGRIPMTGCGTREIQSWRRLGWDGGHLHYFTKGQLDALLRSAGLIPEVWTGDGRWAKLRRWYINFVGNLTVRARREGPLA